MNIENEIIELKRRIADLESLQSNELPFEIAPKISEKRCNWYEAVEYCKFAGQDWRMPTLDELRMIGVTYNDFEPEGVYWSQTGQDDCYVRCLNMRSGAREFHGKLRGTNYIRLIRYIK
jgi:hypothetical protein